MKRAMMLTGLIAATTLLYPLHIVNAQTRPPEDMVFAGISGSMVGPERDSYENSMRIGGRIGIQRELDLPGASFLIGEMAYTIRGTGYKTDGTVQSLVGEMDYSFTREGHSDYGYLEIPVMYGVRMGQVRVYGGPCFGIFLHGTSVDEITYEDTHIIPPPDNGEKKSIDASSMTIPEVGLVIGADYRLGKFRVGPRYSRSLNNVYDNEDESSHFSTVTLTLGYII